MLLGEKFAVKKVQNAFDDLIDAKRILREIRLLRHFNHDNIIRIIDMYPPSGVEFEDIYIVTDLMETDLHRVIYSKQTLTDEHAQYFVYQILRGLKYLHSANVIHRDLKPSNILVNKNCDLKICDFGLARGFNTTDEEEAGSLTDYVVTRWYRAPEVVLIASEYTRAIDVWSVGCILCELIGRKALFPGKDHLDQIRKIVEIMGTPNPNDLSWLPQDGPARRFINKCPASAGKTLAELYPKANPDALEVATRMLTFNPHRRVGVDEALGHRYFEGLHSKEDEPVADHQVDWSFDSFKPTKKVLQQMVYSECSKFHPEIIQRDRLSLQWAGLSFSS
jgi:serine/threonine protein kinase